MGISSVPPIVQSLLDALDFCGAHSRVLQAVGRVPCFGWLDRRSGVAKYRQEDKVQTAVLRALGPSLHDNDLRNILAKKLCVTLGSDMATQIKLPLSWFLDL